MRVGSLFAGIGGFDLAARWRGWSSQWFSEINPFASRVLHKHWPTVPNYGDITLMRGSQLAPIDILCGGFPCQDISLAGAGAGITGARSGLWRHYARLIGETSPRWVVAENVAALRTRGLDRVLRDLDALGYDAEWHCIPASAVGAPHQRDRIWIIAHDAHAVRQRRDGGRHHRSGGSLQGDAQRHPAALLSHRQQPQPDAGPMGSVLSDAISARLQGYAGDGDDRSRWALTARSTPEARLLAGGYPEGWWVVEPDVGRVAHGVPDRVDRLVALGNAVVPHVPYLLFSAIEDVEAALAIAA